MMIIYRITGFVDLYYFSYLIWRIEIKLCHVSFLILFYCDLASLGEWKKFFKQNFNLFITKFCRYFKYHFGL